jgi:hypothetical protein
MCKIVKSWEQAALLSRGPPFIFKEPPAGREINYPYYYGFFTVGG